MAKYLIFNGPMQTTTAPTGVTTGTSLKTMLQVKAGANQSLKICEWGISFDGFAAAAPGRVELIETDVGATVTAHVTAGISRVDAEALLSGDPTASSAVFEVGTGATGYTATVEGSITAVRNLDAPQLIAPTTQFIKQFPLGDEPIIQPAKFARIRLQFAAAINAFCYMVVKD